MDIKPERAYLSDELAEKCHEIVEDLIKLHRETDPSLGTQSKIDKQEKAFLALNKIGLLAGILTEWAECHTFGVYYKISKSKENWIDTDTCNRHDNETMWYRNEMPDDFFVDDNDLMSERAAIAQILHNTFGKYGRMGWRMSLKESLLALNEGQVDELLTPTNQRQHGSSYELQNLKWAAVKHIYKLIGEGWKKTAAQQKIAEWCGASLDSIKKWEREGIKERDRAKSALKAIQFGSFYVNTLKTACPNKTENEILHEAISWNQQAKSGKRLKEMSYGAIVSITLAKDYPLDTLKDRLIEAGFRQSA